MKATQLDIGELRVDTTTGRVYREDGAEVELRHQARHALQILARRPRTTVTREEFGELLWEGRAVTDDSLAQCIADIRRAIGDKNKHIVQTVPRKGYRLVPMSPKAPSSTYLLAWLVGACSVVLAGLAIAWSTASTPTKTVPVIAVLPLDDFSPEPHRGYLSDAISEGIITNLARYPELMVIARNSSFQFRGENTAITKIGEALRAKYVLQGSQQYDGAALRVTAQLLDVSSGAHVWANTFEQPLGNLLAISAGIGHSVAEAVGSKLIDAAVPATDSGEVSALLLENRGRSLFLRKLSRENWAHGVALSKRAIAEFPEAPWGYIGQALALRNGVNFGWTEQDAEAVLEEAERHARQAVSMAPENYMAHYALGRVLMSRRQSDAAIKELERAADLNPSSAMVIHGLIQPYLYKGEMVRVFDLLDHAERIDPLHGRGIHWLRAWAHWQADQCSAARAAYLRMSNPPIESFKLQSAIHRCLGQDTAATEVLRTYLKTFPDWTMRREAELNKDLWTAPGALNRWLTDLRHAGMPN